MQQYAAFISYSHALDRKLAPALQRAIETFAKPWYRMRALRVFRDETNLSVAPDLWRKVEDRDQDFEALRPARIRWEDRRREADALRAFADTVAHA
jgi:hypothetical protein